MRRQDEWRRVEINEGVRQRKRKMREKGLKSDGLEVRECTRAGRKSENE